MDPRKVKAVTDMSEPRDISSLRRFLGMVNQMGKYIPNLADLTTPLRELLNKSMYGCGAHRRNKHFRRSSQL